jgi:gas vesicle protein
MDNNSGKLMLGVLAGAAAGVLLGVLLAPDKGSDTRNRIAQLGDDYAGDITDKIRELRDSINERIDALKGGSGEELADRVKDEASGFVKKATGSRSGNTGGTGNTGGSSGMGGGFSSGNSGGGYSSGTPAL